MIRTFIAFELPKEIRGHLSEVQDHLRQKGLRLRYVPPQNIHITLKFIGDIPEALVDAVDGRMAAVIQGQPVVRLQGKGLGVFPNIRRPRVMWAGLDGELERLSQIKSSLEASLESIGIPSGKRSFKGHVTIGRGKGAIGFTLLKECLREYLDFQTPPFVLKELKLFQSTLKPTGAVYTCLRTAGLG